MEDTTIKYVSTIAGIVVITIAGVFAGHDGVLINSAMLLVAGIGGYTAGRKNV